MANIHPAAEKGFAHASAYASGRPEYSPALDGWLREEIGLQPGSRVVELGAGTGKFTTRLLACGADVIAVEPVPEMREQLLLRHPQVEVRAGTAEAIPVEDGVADALVCAQAFHWFSNAQALAEIRRVLRPGGALGLVWNVRDEGVPWVAELAAMTEPYAGDAPRYMSFAWRRLFPAPGFTPLEERRFPHGHTGSPEQVIVGREMSVSFLAALPPAQHERVAQQIRELIARTPELAGKETVTFPYDTLAYSCRKIG